MKHKAIFYSLICVAIVISLACFLIFKNVIEAKNRNRTALASQTETSVKDGGSTSGSSDSKTDDTSDTKTDTSEDDKGNQPSTPDNPADPSDDDDRFDPPQGEDSDFEILLSNVVDNQLATTKSTIGINYQILFNSKEYINQNILIEIDDTTTAKVISFDAPMILLKRLKKGSVMIKIICAADSTVEQIIHVIFNWCCDNLILQFL